MKQKHAFLTFILFNASTSYSLPKTRKCKVIQNVMKEQQKNCIHMVESLQSRKKYLEQNEEIQQNWRTKEKFGRYISVFLTAIAKV